MFNRYKIQILTLLILIFASQMLHAKEILSLEINHNWNNLTEEEYIANRVACDYKIQQHKWSKNLWPKENKKPKPDFSEVVDLDSIYQKVYVSLKMQFLLSDRFNLDITAPMLQHDLDRMAANTKDANGLRQLFQLFDNSPQTITQCVSLPYLVQKKLTNTYNWSNVVHADTKTLAENELKIF